MTAPDVLRDAKRRLRDSDEVVMVIPPMEVDRHPPRPEEAFTVAKFAAAFFTIVLLWTAIIYGLPVIFTALGWAR